MYHGPGREYTPDSAFHRAKLSQAQLLRLGIPMGCRRVWGAILLKEVADLVRPLVADIARTSSKIEAEEMAATFSDLTLEEAVERSEGCWDVILTARSLRALRKREATLARRKAKSRADVKPWVKIARGAEQAVERERRAQALEIALDNAMLMYDEGLSADQISKALLIPRTKIRERIRLTRRG